MTIGAVVTGAASGIGRACADRIQREGVRVLAVDRNGPGLEDFRARRRTNDAGSMTSVTKTLSDSDIENLANYIANIQ